MEVLIYISRFLIILLDLLTRRLEIICSSLNDDSESSVMQIVLAMLLLYSGENHKSCFFLSPILGMD